MRAFVKSKTPAGVAAVLIRGFLSVYEEEQTIDVLRGLIDELDDAAMHREGVDRLSRSDAAWLDELSRELEDRLLARKNKVG